MEARRGERAITSVACAVEVLFGDRLQPHEEKYAKLTNFSATRPEPLNFRRWQAEMIRASVSPRLLPQLSLHHRIASTSPYLYPCIPSSVTTTIRYYCSRLVLPIQDHRSPPSSLTLRQEHAQPALPCPPATTRNPRDPPIDSTATA